MDAMTKAVYRQAIKLYELYLEGKPINVIDPDGSTPSTWGASATTQGSSRGRGKPALMSFISKEV